MIRLLRASFTVSASASQESLTATITQADLEAAVPTGKKVQPIGVVFDPEDANITLEKIVLASTQNPEGKVSVLPNGEAASLAAINRMSNTRVGRFADMTPEVVPAGIQSRAFTVAHGLQLEVVANNASASPVTITALVRVTS